MADTDAPWEKPDIPPTHTWDSGKGVLNRSLAEARVLGYRSLISWLLGLLVYLTVVGAANARPIWGSGPAWLEASSP